MITDGFVNTKNYFSRQVSIIFYFFLSKRPQRAETDGRLRAVRPAAGAFLRCAVRAGRGGRRFVHSHLWRFAVEGGGKTGLPKIAAQRDFWREERQALRARRQAQRAVRHGALPRRVGGASDAYAELPFPFGSLGKASRPMAARAREQPALRAAGSSLCIISTSKKGRYTPALFAGGDDQTRTDYLYVANVSLYRVSYIPVFNAFIV